MAWSFCIARKISCWDAFGNSLVSITPITCRFAHFYTQKWSNVKVAGRNPSWNAHHAWNSVLSRRTFARRSASRRIGARTKRNMAVFLLPLLAWILFHQSNRKSLIRFRILRTRVHCVLSIPWLLDELYRTTFLDQITLRMVNIIFQYFD